MIRSRNIYKICLITALFLASAGVVWAGFSYNSVGNYFVIDSVFKSGGEFILVGNAFNENIILSSGATTAFFAASNNIIFKDQLSGFCSLINETDGTCTGNRKIAKVGGVYDFKTTGITVKSVDRDFDIVPLEDGVSLTLNGQVASNRDFKLNRGTNYAGLSLLLAEDAGAKTIKAPKILADELKVINKTVWNIGSSLSMEIAAGGEAEAASLVYEESNQKKNLCYIQTWSIAQSIDNQTVEGKNSKDPSITSFCPPNGGTQLGGGEAITCCALDYFVFDMAFDYTQKIGKLVCCRPSNLAPPCTSNDHCAIGKSCVGGSCQ